MQRLNKVIDWLLFRQPIEKAFTKTPKGLGGRPPFDKLMLFKIIILQKYYNLSDDQTEFQIKDRISFMDFLGLELADKIPDAKTIWHFKEQLKTKQLHQTLFDTFTAQLNSQGVIAKEGSMVDASFVDVPRQRNNKADNTIIKENATPIDFGKNKAKLAQKDIDARWATKNKETHYGYKNHVNTDKKTKLINNWTVTNASSHDSTELKNLVGKDDTELYADSAYCSKEIEDYLKTVACHSKVHEKGYRNKPLTAIQKQSNSTKSKTRARVEHVFGFMTNSMNKALEMRQIGRERIEVNIGLLNLTYNLFRYEQIVRLG